MQRTTAYRYLQSLTRFQLVEETEAGEYRLRPPDPWAGPPRPPRHGVVRACPAGDEARLAADVGETALVTRLAGAAVFCFEREDAGVRLVRDLLPRGKILPINAGASAYVLLAWLSEPEVGAKLDAARCEPFTERTLAAKRDIMRPLRDTRERGYAVSRGELDRDVLGVAARLHNKAADVVAAISVAAVFARVADERLPRLAESVCDAAAEITTALGIEHALAASTCRRLDGGTKSRRVPS